MDSVFTQTHIAMPDMCGADAKLTCPAVFTLFQNIASCHAQQLGLGGLEMAARGRYWVAVQTRVELCSPATMMDQLQLESWPLPAAPGDVRFMRNYRLRTKGTTVAQGTTEWTILNDQKRLCRVQDAGFPEDFVYDTTPVFDTPLLRLKDICTDTDWRFAHIVRNSDIDMAQHMNNVAYVRTMLDAFSAEELMQHPVASMEIRYSVPCYEGETLQVYRQDHDADSFLTIRKENGRAAAMAVVHRR